MVLSGANGFVFRPTSVKPRLQRLNAVTARDTGGKGNTLSGAARRQKTPPSSSPRQVCVWVCVCACVCVRMRVCVWLLL